MKRVLMFASIALMISVLSFTLPQDKKQKPWPVPDEYKNMENPTPDNQQTVNNGKALYMRHCASCHGREGKGDGPKARRLPDFPGDFSSASFQDQSDGAIYYKTKEGRGDMPSYEGKMAENDIWALVRYTRTLAQ